MYTKGKWSVSNSGSKVICDNIASVKTICILEISPLKISPEIEANARLIAAAPDLLEALKEFPVKLPSQTQQQYINGIESWIRTYRRQAIEKAESK